jgi:hypothetical protein
MTSRIRKARIPAKAKSEIVFTGDDWKRIEKAYGHSIPQEIRDHIVVATEALSLVGTAERNAPALHTLIEKTEKLKDAAQSLLQEVGHEVKEDAGQTSFETLTESLATAVKEFPYDRLQFLMMVHSVVKGCNLVLRDWKTDGGLREGWIWDAWAQSISELMQHHGLPSAARKDLAERKPNQGEDSPFVRLIAELQKHIPEKLRRHTQSLDALSGAIYRARKSNRWPELLPPHIKEKFASVFESAEEQAERSSGEFWQKLAMDPNWVWVERPSGRIERAEIVPLEGQGEEGQDEQKVEPKSQDG